MKKYIFILLSVLLLHSAFALNVSELNGTNGMTIYNSGDPVLWGWDLSFKF